MNLTKRFISRVLLMCFLCTLILPVPVSASSTSKGTTTTKTALPKAPSIISESAVVMEASTGMILYSKEMNAKNFPASITKIMTTLLAIENSSLSETVTFSKEAIFSIEPGSTHVGSDVGETMTLEQALYCVMLESANEVSNAVAEHVAGSLDAFAKMMTERAKELGCKNTNFVNANGLHDEKHYTTAYDMALITQAAMKNPTFRTITGTQRYDVPPTNKQPETRYLRNHHQMVYPYKYPKYGYDYAIGGKTGYTTKAGNTLVTIAEKDGLELICVVMKSKAATQPENQYTDTIALLDYGFANYSVQKLDNQNTTPTLEENLLFTRYHSLFTNDNAPLKITGSNTVVLPNNASITDVKKTTEYYTDVALQDGENVIGKVTYTLQDTVVGSSNIIYTQKEADALTTATHVVKKNESNSSLSTLFSFKQDSNNFKPITILSIVLIIIALLITALVILKRLKTKQRRRRQRSRRQRNLHDRFMRHY